MVRPFFQILVPSQDAGNSSTLHWKLRSTMMPTLSWPGTPVILSTSHHDANFVLTWSTCHTDKQSPWCQLCPDQEHLSYWPVNMMPTLSWPGAPVILTTSHHDANFILTRSTCHTDDQLSWCQLCPDQEHLSYWWPVTMMPTLSWPGAPVILTTSYHDANFVLTRSTCHTDDQIPWCQLCPDQEHLSYWRPIIMMPTLSWPGAPVILMTSGATSKWSIWDHNNSQSSVHQHHFPGGPDKQSNLCQCLRSINKH